MWYGAFHTQTNVPDVLHDFQIKKDYGEIEIFFGECMMNTLMKTVKKTNLIYTL